MTTVISFVIDQREVLLHFWRKRQRLWPEPRFQVRAEPDTGAATAAGTAILALPSRQARYLKPKWRLHALETKIICGE